MVVNVVFLKQGEQKVVDGKKGLAVTGRDFPIIYQSSKAQLSFILNGAWVYSTRTMPCSPKVRSSLREPHCHYAAGKGVRFWAKLILNPVYLLFPNWAVQILICMAQDRCLSQGEILRISTRKVLPYMRPLKDCTRCSLR